MYIYEAAYLALKQLGRPTHILEILSAITTHSYFHFGAQAPDRALGVAIDRRAIDINIPKPIAAPLFYRSAPATYGLLEWLRRESSDRNADVCDREAAGISALDTALLTEYELHNWLYSNLKSNKLTALGYGPLYLCDPDKQSHRLGKYLTGSAGEIDMLLTTNEGNYLVVELKRSSSDVTVGQICRYVGWVMENLAEPSKKQVFGLILARTANAPLRLAIKATHPNITYRTLGIEATLGEALR